MAAKKEGRWESWDGGRCWIDLEGHRTYYIRRMVGGVRYEVKTGATTSRAAHAQLERFLANPEAYDPRGEGGGDPVYLDADLVRDFLAWSRDVKKNSLRWRGQQRLYLAWWSKALEGVNLRTASLRDHILPALKDGKARPQRIATLKVLYSWLRAERHLLKTAEDRTFGQLKVPQSRPEQLVRSKAVPAEHLRLAVEHIESDRWKDLLRLLAGTGMHVSEAERFALHGRIEPLPRDGRAEGAAGVVVIPSTKAGDPLRVAVSQPVLEAARRVRDAGTFDRQKLAKALHRACTAAGIPRFGPGQMRHAVATAAVNAGADVAQVASFLGHKSPRTTRRFYSTHGTPIRVPALL